MSDRGRGHPGLVKVRAAPLVRRRELRLVSSNDGRWREVLERADVMSEGSVVPEGERLVYYGSTTILLRPGTGAGESLEDLASLAMYDPHVRLRALRLARREAIVRAGAPLSSVSAELTLRKTSDGVVLAVDVVARLQGRRGSAKGGAGR